MSAALPPPEAKPAPSLTRAVTRGFASTAGMQLLGTAIQFAAVLVLARLLTPRDFGIFAMAAALIGIIDLVRDLGLFTVAVQAPSLSKAMRDNLFWLNAGLGAVATTAFALASPVVALLYNEPALAMVSLALAPSFLFTGAQTQYRASLTRELKFTYLAVAGLATALLSTATGIACAAIGFGYWALVVQSVMNALLGLILLAARARWIPGRFQRGIGTRPLLRRGIGFLGSGIVSALTINMPDIVIGRVLGATVVGFYNRSTRIVSTPIRQLQGPANQVIFPALSRVKDDNEKVSRVLTLHQIVACLPIIPVTTAIAAHPTAFVGVLLGEQWTSVSTITALMATSALVASVASPIATMLSAKGLVKELFTLNVITLIANTTAVLTTVWWGLIPVLSALLVANIATRPVLFAIAARRTGVDVSPAVRNAVRIVLAAAFCFAVTAAGVRLVPHQSSVGGLVLAGLLSGSATAFLLVFPSFRRDVFELIRLVRPVQ